MHTPGPWTPIRAKVPADGEYDFAIAAEINGGKYCIAEAFGRVAPEIRPDAEANARLIAAAPKLLAVLKKCNQRLIREAEDSEIMPDEIARIIVEAELAINEAEGRTE